MKTHKYYEKVMNPSLFLYDVSNKTILMILKITLQRTIKFSDIAVKSFLKEASSWKLFVVTH